MSITADRWVLRCTRCGFAMHFTEGSEAAEAFARKCGWQSGPGSTHTCRVCLDRDLLKRLDHAQP